MTRFAVINVVGLCHALLGPRLPRITSFATGGHLARVSPAFPAVTCTAQANYLTGVHPSQHGIVANGWYNRELAEVHFWKQSNHIIQAPKIWEDLRCQDPRFTCAQLFWWFNMYSTADFSITPRPMYPADGRKVFDIYSQPGEIRADITCDLGPFPFPSFWGPAAGRDTTQAKSDAVSQWIADAAIWIENKYSPTLSLVYLPHLDYNLQRLGPAHPDVAKDLSEIDDIVGRLADFFEQRGVSVLLLSEYGIEPVQTPIHLNRLFRERGWLVAKEELGHELLDCGASRVFAVADHQIAHIYVNDPSLLNEVSRALKVLPGVGEIYGSKEKANLGLNHSRAGDLIAVAAPGTWFTYYYWLDDSRAPDFARTVDIHRKPGFDPVELFVDPAICCPQLKIAWRLLQKKIGFRMLMDIVPLDASLVKGSHGGIPASQEYWPVLISNTRGQLPDSMQSTDIYGILKSLVL